MSRRLTTSELVAGLTVARNVYDLESGFLLLKEGTVLNEHHLSHLASAHISEIEVEDAKEEETEAIAASEPDEAELKAREEEAFAVQVAEMELLWEAKRLTSPLTPRTESAAAALLNAIWSEGRISSHISGRLVEGIPKLVESVMGESRLRRSSLPTVAHPKETFNGRTLHMLNCAVIGSRYLPETQTAPEVRKEFVTALLLMDLGLSRVPVKTLESEEPLNEGQLEMVHRHPAFSLEMVQDMDILSEPFELSLSLHHENFDGSGYPTGLRSFEIPHSARIFRVIDCYAALCEERPNRRRLTYKDAMMQLVSGHDSRFAPDAVKQMVELFGFYPSGCVVRLSDGSLAAVTSPGGRSEPLKPKVKLLSAQTGENGPSIDLALPAENPAGLEILEEIA